MKFSILLIALCCILGYSMAHNFRPQVMQRPPFHPRPLPPQIGRPVWYPTMQHGQSENDELFFKSKDGCRMMCPRCRAPQPDEKNYYCPPCRRVCPKKVDPIKDQPKPDVMPRPDVMKPAVMPRPLPPLIGRPPRFTPRPIVHQSSENDELFFKSKDGCRMMCPRCRAPQPDEKNYHCPPCRRVCPKKVDPIKDQPKPDVMKPAVMPRPFPRPMPRPLPPLIGRPPRFTPRPIVHQSSENDEVYFPKYQRGCQKICPPCAPPRPGHPHNCPPCQTVCPTVEPRPMPRPVFGRPSMQMHDDDEISFGASGCRLMCPMCAAPRPGHPHNCPPCQTVCPKKKPMPMPTPLPPIYRDPILLKETHNQASEDQKMFMKPKCRLVCPPCAAPRPGMPHNCPPCQTVC